MANRPTWIEAYRALGNAVLSLARAEAALVVEQWKGWAIEVGKLVAIIAVVLLITVYLPFLLMLIAVEGLAAAAEWPIWAAGLGVLGLVLLFFAVLGAIGYWLVKTRIAPDNPVATVQRRLDDHQGWWRHQTQEGSPGSLEGG